MDELRKEEVEILNELYKSPDVTQRTLAEELDISLGMINLFLRKLSEKGLIKIKRLGKKKTLKYVLTSRGFKERLNQNYELLKGSVQYFMRVREMLLERLSKLKLDGKEVYIYGTDIWAELTYLGVKSYHADFKGFVTDCANGEESKLGYPVFDKESLRNKSEAIMIANRVIKKGGGAGEIEELLGERKVIWI